MSEELQEGGAEVETARERDHLDRHWRKLARCVHESVNFFFSSSEEDVALGLCQRCAVRTECLAYALDERIEHGVFGGTTARWRRKLLVRRSHVASWHQLLAAAKDQYLNNIDEAHQVAK
ncbi:WhiB family transcriptional regulator [Streptomyces sp. NPDC094438]|uniref:WhiB family transcriptional regulator n=1 Tax=Streptomyces sp. NPDC094438 TaxID=3366061 RepID=UPI00382BDEB2